ncbi:MAG TPA: hypothetical protein VIL36_19010 [Acidimicrobiales bacterium]
MRAPEAMAAVADSAEVRAVGSRLPQVLAERVGDWASQCRAALG